MSFTTPTVDVYVPGTTLGIGNVNAGTINIGKAGTTINVGGSMAVTNSVTTPSCTMTSMNVSSLIIAPFSGDVAFNNFSARNATIGNASIMNASFNSINSSNILIGPYPVSGVFSNMNVINASITTAAISNLSSTNINVLNASMTYVNVSGFLINPLPTNPTFTSINTTSIDVDANGVLLLGNQNARAVYIGSSGTRNVINNIGTGSGSGTINIGNDTNSIALYGSVTLAKPLTLQPTTGYVAPSADTMLGGITDGTINLPTFPITSSVNIATMTLGKGTYLIFFGFQIDGNPGQCWIELTGTALPTLNSIPNSYRFGNSVLITGANLQISGSFPYSITTGGTIVLRIQLVGTVTNIPVYKYQAVRIA